MNALPLSSQALLPVAPATGGAAVLPAVLSAALPKPAGTAAPGRAPTPFTFDRTLQQLLAASALPAATALAPTDPDGATPTAMATMATLTAADGETGSGTDASAAALPFDPALASLVPPAAVAMAQASAPMAPATATAQGRAASPGLAASASIGATGLATAASGREAALPPLSPPGTAAAANTTAVVGMPAALPGDAGPASAQERPAASLLPTLLQASAAGAPAETADIAAPARAGDAAQPGRAPSLLQQLGDRVAVQIERGSERVVIRLDPPHRGQIEIHIRQDASGATQVHLTASHGEVVRQLHAIGDSLRQELAQRQGGDVSVQIAQHGSDPDGRQRQERDDQPQQQPGRALDDQAEPADGARFALATERP